MSTADPDPDPDPAPDPSPGPDPAPDGGPARRKKGTSSCATAPGAPGRPWPAVRSVLALLLTAGCGGGGTVVSTAEPDPDADPSPGPDPEPGPGQDPDPDDEPVTIEPIAAQRYAYDRSVTEGNALKGFLTSYAWGEPTTQFPSSMEFAYVPFDALMPAPGAPDVETALEPLLEAAAGRGHHLVVRPYLDYPELPSAVPAWLVDAGVEMRAYDDYGGGRSPDYAHPALRAALGQVIAAFGAAYDGDARLGVVQLGLLGFWGEWHTYPHEDWFAGEEVQDEVLRAYEAAFPTTHLQVRYPVGASPTLAIGFHDDSFAFSTVGDTDWHFVPLLQAAGAAERWRWVPIGGEVRPEIQAGLFDAAPPAGAQDFEECVTATHASWLVNAHAFAPDDPGAAYAGEALARARRGALSLGWEVTVEEVRVGRERPSDLSDPSALVVELDLRNPGVAPFYYPLALSVTADCCAAERLAGIDDLQPSTLGGATAPTTVKVRLDGLPPDALAADRPALTLALTSPMRLPGQRLAFANAEVDDKGRLRF